MAILRSNEVKEMSAEEMDERISQLQNDLMKIRGVLASGGIPENVGQVREIKRTIARIKTFKNQKTKEKVITPQTPEKAADKPKKK